MKTMKYILLVICVICASTVMAVDCKLYQTSSATLKSTSTSGYSSAGIGGGSTRSVSASAQGVGAMVSVPAVSFRSTSVMPSTGSKLSVASSMGVTIEEGDNASIPSGPKRLPALPPDPFLDPLGDAVLPLLLLAAGYVIYLRRKNSVRTSDSGHQQ
jgi:hypothetical protein